MINLNDFRMKKYSQFQEDGISLKIFDIIGLTNKIGVEIGVQSGTECCSRILRDIGIEMLLFDNNHSDPKINLQQATVTIDNAISLIQSFNIPKDLDFLAVDIDSFDFYVVHKILEYYKPRVLIVETNPTFTSEDKVVKLGHPMEHYWAYHGASLAAWLNTLTDYDLVCHEWGGINAFFVRKGLMPEGLIDNIGSMSLFSSHVAAGYSLHTYTMYPPHFPILTGSEALELLHNTK